MHRRITLEAAATRREWVFPFLTLDVVRVFYDLMGLAPAFHDVLHQALRDATLATRKQLVQALTAGGPKPTLASFCAQVERAAGPDAVVHLAKWIQCIFHADPQDHRALDSWRHVLRHCQREGDECWRALFPLNLWKEVAARSATVLDRTEFTRRCAALEGHPLSDWDLHMYASQTYDFDDDPEGAWPNPFTHVSLTIRAYQEFVFWAWVLRTLTPDQQTELREGALEIARAAGLSSVKDLAAPSALDIGL